MLASLRPVAVGVRFYVVKKKLTELARGKPLDKTH